MSSEWVLNDFWMSSEWHLNDAWMTPEWLLNGFWTISEQMKNEFGMSSEWILNGFWMSYAWVLSEFWMNLNEFRMNFQLAVRVLCWDNFFMLMGPYFVRMKPTTSRKLFQMLPGLQNPYKIQLSQQSTLTANRKFILNSFKFIQNLLRTHAELIQNSFRTHSEFIQN